MRVLFIGDIFGKPGRRLVQEKLHGLIQEYRVDFCITNVENSAAGFGVGFIAAFLSAFACVRWLIRYVASHDFKPFAWYRIVFGMVVLATAYSGVVQWSAG